MKLSQYFTSHTKINTKWITGLSVNPKAIKLTEENKGENLGKSWDTKISSDTKSSIKEKKNDRGTWAAQIGRAHV